MAHKGKCKLCLLEKELSNSHIYPEFFYRPMYVASSDPNRRFLILSSDPNKPEKHERKGVREFLLCRDCEQRFSFNEKYAREVIYGGTTIHTAIHRNELHIKRLDYKRFKLFLLSLLWRISIAQDRFFSQVSLSDDEDSLRLMLLNDDPGADTDFPCLIVGVRIEGELGNWFLPPDKVVDQERTVVRAVIGGQLFMFFVNGPALPPVARPYFLARDGSIIIRTDELTGMHFLREDLFEVAKASLLRQIPSQRRKA